MRGRREKDIDAEIREAAEFALALRGERERRRVTYRQMAESVHYSATALSRAADGRKLPTWAVAEAYLRACAVAPQDLPDWERRWKDARMAGRLEQIKAGQQPPARTPARHRREVDPVGLAGLDRPTADLLKVLHDLRTAKGMSLQRVADNSAEVQRVAAEDGRAIGRLSKTRIHEVEVGRRLVDDEFVELFLLAVGADKIEQNFVGVANGYRLRHCESPAGPERVPPPVRVPDPVRVPEPQPEPVVVRAVGRASVAVRPAIGRAAVPMAPMPTPGSWLTDSYVDELPPVPISPAPRRPVRTPAVRSHRSPNGYHAPRSPRLPRPKLKTLRPVLSGSAGLLTVSGTGILAGGLQPALTAAASVDLRALAGAFLVLAGLMLLVLSTGLAYLVWANRITPRGRHRAPAARRNPLRAALATG